MKKYIVYFHFPMSIESDDFAEAEKEAMKIFKRWENRPKETELTVREASYKE